MSGPEVFGQNTSLTVQAICRLSGPEDLQRPEIFHEDQSQYQKLIAQGVCTLSGKTSTVQVVCSLDKRSAVQARSRSLTSRPEVHSIGQISTVRAGGLKKPEVLKSQRSSLKTRGPQSRPEVNCLD